jgi:hypothetical protein
VQQQRGSSGPCVRADSSAAGRQVGAANPSRCCFSLGQQQVLSRCVQRPERQQIRSRYRFVGRYRFLGFQIRLACASCHKNTWVNILRCNARAPSVPAAAMCLLVRNCVFRGVGCLLPVRPVCQPLCVYCVYASSRPPAFLLGHTAGCCFCSCLLHSSYTCCSRALEVHPARRLFGCMCECVTRGCRGCTQCEV